MMFYKGNSLFEEEDKIDYAEIADNLKDGMKESGAENLVDYINNIAVGNIDLSILDASVGGDVELLSQNAINNVKNTAERVKNAPSEVHK